MGPCLGISGEKQCIRTAYPLVLIFEYGTSPICGNTFQISILIFLEGTQVHFVHIHEQETNKQTQNKEKRVFFSQGCIK